MPRVPKISENRIQDRAAPVVQTSTQAPSGVFGGSQEELANSQAGSVAAGMINKHADEQLNRANKLWFLSTESSIANKQLEIETEARKQKGRNAFGLQKSTQDELDAYIGTLKSNNEDQALGLENIKTSRKTSMNRTITGHVSGEIEQVETQESEAYRFNLTNSASSHYDDPMRFSEDQLKYNAAVEDEADRQGYSGETKKAYILGEKSRFHIQTIEAMLNEDDHKQASQYFKDNKGELTQDAIESIQGAIKEGDLRSESLMASDDIIAAHESLGDQFKAANKIKDADTRDAVKQRLRQNAADNDRVARDEAEDRSIDYLNQIESSASEAAKLGHNVTAEEVLGAANWSKLTQRERINYKNHAAASSYSNNPKVIAQRQANKDAKIGALWNLMSNPKEFEKQTTYSRDKDGKYVSSLLNLEAIKSQIGEKEYNRFKAFQKTLRSNETKDAESAITQQMKDTLEQFKVKYSIDIMADRSDLDVGDEEDDRDLKLAQLRGEKALREFVDSRFDALDPKLQTPDEHQKIIDLAWLNVDVQRAGIWTWDQTEEIYGDGTLPLFLTVELAENATDVLKDSKVENSSELSDDSRAYLKSTYGIPTKSPYDFKNKEFTVKGKELRSYLDKIKKHHKSRSGADITSIKVGLDGKPVGKGKVGDVGAGIKRLREAMNSTNPEFTTDSVILD